MIDEKSRRKMPSWAPQVLGYCLSAACLVWVLHGYNFAELLPKIRELDVQWVAVAVAADLSVYLAHGWRWNTLLAPVARLRFWTSVQAIYIGLFANEVLPLRAGELIRCYLLAHWNDLRISVTFASVAVERIFDGIFMVSAFLITAAVVKAQGLNGVRIPEDLIIVGQGIGVLVLAGAAVLLWVALHKQHAHAVVGERRWSSMLRPVIEGLHLMGNPLTLGKTALISLVYLFLQILTVYALMKAYRLDLSFWVAGGVLTLVRLGTVVPNAPGNLGLLNLVCVMALHLFEVEIDEAKTFSFILYGVLTIPLLIGGAIATALSGLNIGELRDHARRGIRTAHGTPAPEEQ